MEPADSGAVTSPTDSRAVTSPAVDETNLPGSPFIVDGVRHERMNNFVTQWIDRDLMSGKHKSTITRFPPEPNGYLHLGHAKSICLNFGIAKQYGGQCNLRFDDTNPTSEEEEYIEGIQADVRWLGFDWGDNLFFASDYFPQLYEWAVKLIKLGLAYVDDQTEEEVRINRGSLLEPGKNSPYRDRSVEENLRLFEKMKNGEFPDGHCVLRAKIDMAHGNMNLRDPPIYRIKHASHPRTGTTWCIYPIYDYAHGQSDSIEKITHSICTLEFYDHRALYDWCQEKLDITRTQQIEFARFNLTYTVMSKRRLLRLVQNKYVRGWDDPRMPTLCGARRRGYPPCAIRKFAYSVGVAKRDNTIPLEKLESYVRSELHPHERRMVVTDPLKVTLTNWSEDKKPEIMTHANHPELDLGVREIPFSRVLYIERSDFMEVAAPKFFRLTVGGEVRLKGAYWIKCTGVIRDENTGDIKELLCTYDPETKGGVTPSDGRKVKGVIHWASEAGSIEGELRIYSTLFTTADPDEGAPEKTWEENLNPESLIIRDKARLEKCLANPKETDRYQFERVGFFVGDKDSTPERPVFNLTVGLVDTFAAQSEATKEAKAKDEAKLARERAAEERRLKKEAKAKREAEKLGIKQTDAA